jgi:hypothetical protein
MNIIAIAEELFEAWLEGNSEKVLNTLECLDGIDNSKVTAQLLLMIIDDDTQKGVVGELPRFIQTLEGRNNMFLRRELDRCLQRGNWKQG